MSQATTRSYSRADSADHAGNRRPVLIFVGILIAIVLTFYGIRIATDAPFLISGIQPEPEDFESRYVAHPWLAYLHMTPGALYLLRAPLQLSQRIRTRHYTLHRRLGRVLVTAALVSVLFAFLFGLRFPWGGLGEAMATAVFSCWFVACLALAVGAIRRDDVVNHRRWMIRAFVTGCRGRHRPHLDRSALRVRAARRSQSFAAAFWIAFSLHVLAGERWMGKVVTPW